MRKSWLFVGVVALCGVSFLAGQVTAQEAEEMEMQPPEWMKLTKEHEDFKKSVGDWTATSKHFMGPDAPPMESKGTATARLAFGGRFLEQDYTGEMAGQTFTGKLYVGFDTVDKEFVSIWLSDFSPVPWIGRGTEKDGVTTIFAMEPDWMTGKKIKTKMKLWWEGDDEYRIEMYKLADDGSETRMGETIYKRVKKDDE